MWSQSNCWIAIASTQEFGHDGSIETGVGSGSDNAHIDGGDRGVHGEEVAGGLEAALFPDGAPPNCFGMVDIYNPWSILNFLDSKDRNVIPYWVGTSANTLIRELLQHYAFDVRKELQTLLEGGYIEEYVDENVVFPNLRNMHAPCGVCSSFQDISKRPDRGRPLQAKIVRESARWCLRRVST